MENSWQLVQKQTNKQTNKQKTLVDRIDEGNMVFEFHQIQHKNKQNN